MDFVGVKVIEEKTLLAHQNFRMFCSAVHDNIIECLYVKNCHCCHSNPDWGI